MCKSYKHLQYVPIDQNAYVQRRLWPLTWVCPQEIKVGLRGEKSTFWQSYMHLNNVNHWFIPAAVGLMREWRREKKEQFHSPYKEVIK